MQNNLRHFFLDYDRLHNLITMASTDIPKRFTANFPPVDVYQLENLWVIRMAVAGFTASDLDVSVEEEQLIVKSSARGEDEVAAHPANLRIHQRGIGKRAFERRWQLSEGMEVTEVALQDGILTIGVTQMIPENKRPKKFDITPTLSTQMLQTVASGLLEQ